MNLDNDYRKVTFVEGIEYRQEIEFEDKSKPVSVSLSNMPEGTYMDTDPVDGTWFVFKCPKEGVYHIKLNAEHKDGNWYEINYALELVKSTQEVVFCG